MIPEWKPVPGFEGLYSVSSFGEVRSEARTVVYKSAFARSVACKLKDTSIRSGYKYVMLYKENVSYSFAVHRLVLLAFVGAPSDGMVAAHNDGSRTNNNIKNLRWATPKENMADRILHGTSNRGERHGMSKLTRESVMKIRSDNRSHSEIAAAFGIRSATVSRLKLKKDWAWL